MVISISNGDSHVDVPDPVDRTRLPSSKSDEIQLVQATFAEHMQSSRLNGDEWRGPLTIEQYLKREKYLLAQNLTKDGKEAAWLLTSATLPTDDHGNRPILAACETIPMQAYTVRAGILKEALAQGIGSVFTRPEHRGKSYASRMMVEVGKKLETFQQRNGDRSPLSVLYSDIGQNFYSRFGWEAFPSTHIHLSPLDTADYEQLSQDLPAVTDLTTADLHTIPATEYVKEELICLSKAKPSRTFVAIAPDLDHFTWHHAREDHVSKALGRQVPNIKGSIHKESGIALIWTRTFAADKAAWMLHVLHIAMPPLSVRRGHNATQILAALLLRAQHEASLSEMAAGVEVWDPSEEIVDAARQLRAEKGDELQVIQRDQEHICSLRWTGLDADPQDVEWTYRQKYAWC